MPESGDIMTAKEYAPHIGETDRERFRAACRRLASAGRSRDSIGTLSEKTLHATLKFYYEADSDCHEVPVGAYVADIVGEHGIIEIQTRGFSRLKSKLAVFLEAAHVTVVYPIICQKTVISIAAETGEVMSSRKSPKKGSLYTSVRELYTIREFLSHPRLTVKLVMLAADEVRFFGVRTRRRKKQRTRSGEYVSDLIPTDIFDEITLSEPQDYDIFLPRELKREEMPFGASELAAAAHADADSARMALNLLTGMGVVNPAGKKGNAKLYLSCETFR